MTESLVCWNCGKLLDDVPLPMSRHANCADCFEVLYCCRMCTHYVLSQQGQCDDVRADPPAIKEHANFCEFLNPAHNAFRKGSEDKARAAKSRFNDLVEEGTEEEKDSTTNSTSSDDHTRSKLDDLFDS